MAAVGMLLLSSNSELASTLIESDGMLRNSSDAEPLTYLTAAIRNRGCNDFS